MIGAIIGVILLAIVVACVFIAEKSKKKRKKNAPVFVALAGVFGLLLILIPPSFHTVNAGEIAVVKHLGKAEKVRTAGTYFDF